MPDSKQGVALSRFFLALRPELASFASVCFANREGQMMVRALSDYDFSDWRRLRPLSHALKTARYRLVNQRYVRRAAVGDTSALLQGMAGKRVLVTIAFGDAEVIDWQVQLVRHYVRGIEHVVADNSLEQSSAARIAAVCNARKIKYLRLPPNPWREPSRSHGIALNWVWHNVIAPAKPELFGFLDHDVFPTARDDPFAALSTQACFGVIRTSGQRWFLWAGYCMFRFDRVREAQLDFGQDWFNGLDTGGGNWRALYRHLDRTTLKEASTIFEPYKPGVEVAEGPLQWVGTWLHEVGQMVTPELGSERRQVVRSILAPHLAAAQHAACVTA